MNAYLDRVSAAIAGIPLEKVDWLVAQLRAVRERESCVYVLGNGGSAALAQHLVLHLRQCEIRAFDLMADPAWLTAMSNDYGYKNAPTALLDVLFKPYDMLLVISGSGKSENVKAAVRAIAAVGGCCVGILGNDGGKVVAYCADAVVLPELDYGPLEDCFSAIIHILAEGLHDN